MRNKIDHANRILRFMDRFPNMTVKELLFLIECRIEGEKFVISSYRWSVQMLQVQYDNRDNFERLQFLVWDAGKVQWEDCPLSEQYVRRFWMIYEEIGNCFVDLSHKVAFDLLYREAWRPQEAAMALRMGGWSRPLSA